MESSLLASIQRQKALTTSEHLQLQDTAMQPRQPDRAALALMTNRQRPL